MNKYHWITPTDTEVLHLLARSRMALPPTAIAYNIGRSRGAVSRSIDKLRAARAVERSEEHPYYGIKGECR